MPTRLQWIDADTSVHHHPTNRSSMRANFWTNRVVRAVWCFAFYLGPFASAQRDLTEIPEPDPAAEMEAMRLDESAAVNLFAADPAIRKPIQMNFDCTGALWVASSSVYPQIKPGEVADDKIIVLRDTDHDGVHDRQTVFADGLLIPTGVIPDGPDAAYVAESTQLLYLRDTDGDGRADSRRVVFSGFGTEDTHHLLHTLRWGPDGCLYFNQSIYIHSHIDTVYGTKHLDGGGIWRFRPSTGRLEVFCKGFVNPWGHVFDHYGESFVTDGAYFEGINYVFPDSVFVTSPGAERWLKGLNPGSPKHCGLEILSGTHIPEAWSGDLITNDFRSHRVCRFTIRPAGSSYQSRQQPEIITTPHVAFRPIDVRMGPDGAIYVADWYNPIIQHGEVDFRDERRDREHGRIWRVSFPGRALDPWPDFQSASVEQLVDLLEDPSLAVRQFARQQLWDRSESNAGQVQASLNRWSELATDDQAASRALELLWMDEVLGNVSPEHLAMIDPDIGSPATRTQMRSAWRNRVNRPPDDQVSADAIDRIAGWSDHPDPRVRLEAVIINGQLDGQESAANHLIDSISHQRDDCLDFAIWQAIRQQSDDLADLSLRDEIDWTGREDSLAYVVSAIGTSDIAEIAIRQLRRGSGAREADNVLVSAIAETGDADQLGRLLERILSRPRDETFAEAIAPLLARTRRDGIIPKAAGDRLSEAVGRPSRLKDHPRWGAAIATAAEQWNAEALGQDFAGVLDDVGPALQSKLIAALGSFDTPLAKNVISELVQSADPAVRVAAIRAMSATRPANAANRIVGLLSDPETSDAAIEMFVDTFGRAGSAHHLAKAVKDRDIPSDVARVLLRRTKASGGNENLQSAIRESGRLDDVSWKLTPEFSERVLTAARQHGSAASGEDIYRRAALQCVDCHAIGTAGGVVGPNLISLGGSSQPDYILQSLIEPNAKLKEGYSTLSVLTDEGELINGIPAGKSEDFLTLRLADGKEKRVAIESIEAQKPGKSLMPAGILDELTESELVDLVAFLSALGRTADYTVSTELIVRSVQTLVFSSEANRRLNRTSTDTVASGDSAMTWRLLTSRVDGTFSIDEMDVFQQHKTTPPTSFIRFMVTSTADGPAGIEFPGDGIECWLDGKPTPSWELKDRLLEQGTHTIVLSIDRTVCQNPFSIRLGTSLAPVAPTLSP